MKYRLIRNSLAAIFLALAAVMVTHTTALADTVAATSANWAGYIASGNTYTGVSGTFVMPALSYSSTLASNATWVGIGGKTSDDLIQAGVYEIANSDGATYQAWYELLPQDSTPINLPVHPGDSISIAIIETSQDTWNIVITNNTTKQQYEKTVQYTSSLSSAEWIQERPLVDGTFSNLSGFTPVAFSGATAVQNGVRVSLAQTGAQMINLTDSFNNVALAVPSPVDTSGTSFTVYRTSASIQTASVAPAPTIVESITPPDDLRRTGHVVFPLSPWGGQGGVTWIINFAHHR